MRWFKHLTNMHDNDRVGSLLAYKNGLELYGLHCLILEIVAANTKDDKPECSFPLNKWATICQMTPTKFDRKLMRLCQVLNKNGAKTEQNLMELGNYFLIKRQEADEKCLDIITISVPKLIKYRDEYSQRQAKNRE